MTRRFILLLTVALLASLHPASAQVASTLVEDDFDGLAGAPPDAAKFIWGGEVSQNGSGFLYFGTDSANTSWLQSQTGTVVSAGSTLDLRFTASAYAEDWYPGIYGDGQPRGLRVGNDANNAIEFYSAANATVGMRVHNGGAGSDQAYAITPGVGSMHLYEISVTSTSAVFKVDGSVAGTFTANLPAGTLNFYIDTFDGYAGNVPVYLDSVSLTLTNNQVQEPPAISSFAPTNGPVGTSVAINGTNFIGITAVQFGGVDAAFTNNSDSLITAIVPGGAATGLITVVSTNGTASSSNNFCVLEALDFIYTTNNGTVTITSYTGSGGAVTIPDTIYGLPVTGIGINAFNSRTSLTNVTVPDNVTSIGDTAFAYCSSLTNVVIGSSVTNIGYHVFFSCPSLAAITVDVLNPAFSSLDGVLFDQSQATLIQYPEAKTGSYTVPDGVVSIGNGAFDHGTSLAGVTIPDSVTNIADGAFYSCASLTNVTIGNNVTSIGNGAFDYCTSLSNITIPDSVTTINSAFSDCTGLAGITLGNGVTDIGGAFVRCSSLASVIIPNSVTSIGDMTFAGCSSLTNVMIPDSVTGIGNSAFSACTSLASITIPDSVTNIGNYAFDHCTSLNNVAIGNSVTSLGSDAFYFCTSLNNVILPNSITSIGSGAFSVCTSLTSITIPNSLTNIADYTFSSCYGLTDVTIPNSISTIGSGAFATCYHLTSITIPNSVTSIGDWAFNACYGLTSITIPNSVTSVGGYAFYNCTSLSSVTIGTNVTSIGTYAFAWCNSLANITIPTSISSIGYAAFYNCSQLTGIYFQGNVPSLGGSSVFDGANNTTVYYLPGATGWNPQAQTRDASFGVRTNQFGFNLTGSSGLGIVVEACTNLANSTWSPVETITFTGNSSYFGDPQWTNYPTRFYRLWNLTFGGRPAVLWNPQMQTRDASFGARTNHFGFTITGSSNLVIVVEACTNLAHPVWTPVGTNTLTGGASCFNDPQWTNYPARFYRLRSP